jgi:hypothetical protein
MHRLDRQAVAVKRTAARRLESDSRKRIRPILSKALEVFSSDTQL